MSAYKFYHKATGLFLPAVFQTDDPRMLRNNTPAGHAALEGEYDHLSQRVDVSDPAAPKVVDYQPPQPSSDHEWNASTKRWQLSQAAAGRLAAQTAARQRIVELEASAAPLLRKSVLGDAAALDALRALDAEISALQDKA